MKKRELLIILFLAVFLTIINFLRPSYHGAWGIYRVVRGRFFWWNFPLQILDSILGELFLISPSCIKTSQGLACPSISPSPAYYWLVIILDFLFWFLILFFGYQSIKYIFKKGD